ncbi:MAG: NADH-quinone oxidoreductase subunit L, partial [Candidatus Gastranaerophilales bacterium]|nr:NADH-quinone oxidoreductase subunit L [Candidatus Gastranaerophilales bacterium]
MTDFCANNILLILFLPLWVSLIILSAEVFKFTLNREITVLLTVLSTAAGFIFSRFLITSDSLVAENSFLWFNTGELNIFLGSYIDNISLVFLAILTSISIFVQIYSYGYMKDTQGFNRYFIYLNLFNFAMAGLILSPNLIQLYIFWELVSVISYLLIGFFHNKEDVSKSAKKVFIINRIGDTALLCGIIIFAYFSIFYMEQSGGSFLSFGNLEYFKIQMQSLTYPNVYNLICLLFLIGAFVKSAQFPFQQWLIDAMKAPTPVSALIHSATMVCAGIFLIIRIYPLLEPVSLNIILTVGTITAVLCAFMAIGQTNIKKMLAYSTASQLGLMFTAIGLGQIVIAIIYLVIHSCTKALLFLCTGNISKICNTIDMKEISGLKKIDFYLSAAWLIGALSLSGLFFGGLISKELLINSINNTNNMSLLFLVLLTSFMSAYYIFRAYFNIFEGENTVKQIQKEKSMNFSLGALCVYVIFPVILFIFRLSWNMLFILTIAIGLTAVISAYFHHKCSKNAMPDFLYKLSENELFIPKIYDFLGKIFTGFYKIIFFFEKYIIEASVNMTAI